MLSRVLILVGGTVSVVVSTALAAFVGYSRERAELSWEMERLDQQLDTEFSQNLRLAVLLSGHRDIRAVLGEGVVAPAAQNALDRLVLATARGAILVADTDGRIRASGLRNPDRSPPLTVLPEALRNRVNTQHLSRRFLQHGDQGWMFETAKPVFGPDRSLLGYVLSYSPLADLAQRWRALPDNMELTSAEGAVLYAHSRFAAGRWAPLRLSQVSKVHGTTLVMERTPEVLVAYGAVGGAFGLVLALAVVFGLSSAARRRALTQARMTALAADAKALEMRVAERTQALRDEIEDHKQTEQALQDSQARLVQTAKLTVLNDLAAGLSHELSQPLFALEAGLDSLRCQMEGSPQAQSATLDRVQRVASRMGHILNNLKTFARRDADPPTTLDLTGPVAAALEMLDHKITRQGILVDHQLPQGSAVGTATPTGLQQVVVNILSNSCDAVAGDGSGRLRIDYPGGRQIRILDNGPGFSDRDNALRPFSTTKSDPGNLGLGLSISADIMERFGGALSLGAGDAGGACVMLDFATAAQATAAQATVAQTSAPQVRGE